MTTSEIKTIIIKFFINSNNYKLNKVIITKIRAIYLILIVTILSSFGIKSNRNYQTECVTIETDGYVTIKIWDTKEGAKYNSEQARKDAVDAILFSGISGGKGCSTQYPILNKTEAELPRLSNQILSDWLLLNNRI